MIFNPTIPIKDGKLTGPIFLSCGCGTQTARWATIQQNLVTRIPSAKPKASKVVKEWVESNKLGEKFPILNKHQYGLVVEESANGFEGVDIMSGATTQVVRKIADLVRRSNEHNK